MEVSFFFLLGTFQSLCYRIRWHIFSVAFSRLSHFMLHAIGSLIEY